MSSSSSSSSGGIGFVGLLTIVFIVLKLIGTISWSWWWVLSPIWISSGLGILFLLCMVIGWFVQAIIEEKRLTKKSGRAKKNGTC